MKENIEIRFDIILLFNFQEWPFVKVDAYLLCSHCLAVGIEKPYLWRGEVLDIKNPKGIYHLQCPKTEPDVLIPACLVYPIDPGLYLGFLLSCFQ